MASLRSLRGRRPGLALTTDALLISEADGRTHAVPYDRLLGLAPLVEREGPVLYVLDGDVVRRCPMAGWRPSQTRFLMRLVALGRRHPRFASENARLLERLETRLEDGDPVLQRVPAPPPLDGRGLLAVACAASGLATPLGPLASFAGLALTLGGVPTGAGRGPRRVARAVGALGLLGWTLLVGAGARGHRVTVGWVSGGPELGWLGGALLAAAIIGAIVYHEMAHGLAAYWCGDRTARRLGRLSLNPLRHVSLLGTVIVPATILLTMKSPILFGWAKPVPVQRQLLVDPKGSLLHVAIAGPAINGLLALISAWLLIVVGAGLQLLAPSAQVAGYVSPLVWVQISGVRAAPLLAAVVQLLKYSVAANIVLGALNLTPIPPLDGSRIMEALLPEPLGGLFGRAGCGVLVLIALVLSGGLAVMVGLASAGALVTLWLIGLVTGMLPA